MSAWGLLFHHWRRITPALIDHRPLPGQSLNQSSSLRIFFIELKPDTKSALAGKDAIDRFRQSSNDIDFPIDGYFKSYGVRRALRNLVIQQNTDTANGNVQRVA